MTKTLLITQLDQMGPAKLVNRTCVANFVLDHPECSPSLIELVFDVKNKLSIKAAWTLEIICRNNIDWLAPYLNEFTAGINRVVFGSAVRPMSKICELLAKEYSSKKDNLIKESLSDEHIDTIIEAGFDWLISQHKVAVKAFAMESLYLFGKYNDWVHDELKLIMEKNMAYESSGYCARAKKILHWINENK